MTDYLIDPPVEKLLPVTRGADRAFSVRRVDASGDPVNYDTGTVSVWIDIDPTDPTEVRGHHLRGVCVAAHPVHGVRPGPLRN